ncbi:hypothetical protein DFH11DRAFT_1722036 [Phellopilus nigrolimitatus]|nr:hypothetical protein DFH11DRAFT_1722036 [Phellopilus nigrolimitatus]
MAFSSSQMPLSSQNRPPVFLDNDGIPLNIFVESNGVSENRPRLVRSLRNHGANICADVSLSRIIIVEPNSPEGRQFVRDWGADPGKIILEVAWIHRSIDAGHALLEQDAWGGCGNLDGTPLPGDDVDADDAPGPSSKRISNQRPRLPSVVSRSDIPDSLPTPRQTPVDRISSRSGTFSAIKKNMSASSQRLPTPPSTSSSTSFHTQKSAPPPLQTHNLPPNHPSSMQPSPPIVPSVYDMAVARPAQFPNFGLPTQTMQQLIMQNPELQAMAVNLWMQQNIQGMQGMQGTQGMNFPSPSVWPQIPNNQYMQAPSPFTTMQSQQPQPQMPMPMPIQTPQLRDPSPPIKDEYSPPPLETEPSHHYVRRSPSPLPTFTTFQDRLSSSPPISTAERSMLSQKGKKRSLDSNASFSSPKASRRRTRSPPASSSRRREKKSKSLIEPKPSLEPVRREIIRKEAPPPIGFFTAQDGTPMKFFLQVQIRNRVQLIAQIRKNGGQISKDLDDATWIILFPNGGKFTDQWMKVAKDLKRTVLRPGFLEACLEAGEIVDDTEFRMDPAKKRGASVRKSSGMQPPALPHRDLSPDLSPEEEEEIVFSSPTPPPASQQSKSTSRTGNGSTSATRGRSPTPPVGKVKVMGGGRHAFTHEEKEYALKFVRYHLRDKPDASMHSLGSEISRRVPTHPQNSWVNTLYKYNKEIDRIREELVAEKHGTPENAVEVSSEPEIDEVEEVLEMPAPGTVRGRKNGQTPVSHAHGAANGTAHEKPTVPANGSGDTNGVGKKVGFAQAYDGKEEHAEHVDADLKTIIDYFVRPPEGVTDDEKLWAALEEKYQCLTAHSWQDFYEMHTDEVNTRLRKALNLADPDPAEEQPQPMEEQHNERPREAQVQAGFKASAVVDAGMPQAQEISS